MAKIKEYLMTPLHEQLHIFVGTVCYMVLIFPRSMTRDPGQQEWVFASNEDMPSSS